MRITAVSDTHCQFPVLAGGDLLIHAGDFSHRGRRQEVTKFLSWLERQLGIYGHVVFIAGNHELSFEAEAAAAKEWMKPYLSERLIYLEHEEKTVAGLRIFGSPYTPRFGNWGFNVDRGDLPGVWEAIPHGLDLLVTHGPPLGVGDFTYERHWSDETQGFIDLKTPVGDEALLQAVGLKKPCFHIFGHIHEGYGTYQGDGELAGVTLINAAQVDETYRLRPDAAISFEIK